jgi:hypothetical protein
MPELVISRHGRYELVQGSGGVEVREDLSKRRRARTIIATAMLGAAAVLHFGFGHRMAIPFAIIGGFSFVLGFLPQGRVLVLGDTEIRWGGSGHGHDRQGVWPRSRVSRVRVEQHGTVPRPAERGRRFGPVFLVRIAAADGALHPARFGFRSEQSARDLARVIAERLNVPLDEK